MLGESVLGISERADRPRAGQELEPTSSDLDSREAASAPADYCAKAQTPAHYRRPNRTSPTQSQLDAPRGNRAVLIDELIALS